MVKKILFISLFSAMVLCVPFTAQAETMKATIENDLQSVTMTVNESSVHITGANGMTLQIFNITGVSIGQYKIDSADKHIELNLQKGCYILKVGKVVRKISIR
jgi:hypothetical protein